MNGAAHPLRLRAVFRGIRHVEADLFDVFSETDQERPFMLAGDRLTLTPSWAVDGKQWTGVRVFERVK